MTFALAPLERGAYRAIIADPPWGFRSNSLARPGRNAMRHYRCMTMAEIEALPVGDLAAPDSYLFLWITKPFLVVGAHLPLLKAWGFKPSTIGFDWIKTRLREHDANRLGPITAEAFVPGQGFTTRLNAEHVVIGRRGGPMPARRDVRSTIVAPRREHSRKPDAFYEAARAIVGTDARIADLFARESRPGIETWGAEATKFDGAAG